MYSTEFVSTLIEEFWQCYQTSIFLLVFIPFAFYAVSCIVYFSVYYDSGNWVDKTPEFENYTVKLILKVWIYVITLYMFSFEVFQMKDNGLKYITELINVADLCSTGLILYLLITEDFFSESESSTHIS